MSRCADNGNVQSVQKEPGFFGTEIGKMRKKQVLIPEKYDILLSVAAAADVTQQRSRYGQYLIFLNTEGNVFLRV